jgi:HEPN domain-containing protein
MDDKVKHWLELSDEDLTVAQILLDGKKFLYSGFMCHMTIEKALKAVIARDCEEGKMPPKIHNLIKLVNRAGLYDKMTDEQLSLIDKLNPLNIEARYPEYKDEIAASMSKESCIELIKQTKEMQCWIKKQL